MMKYLIPLSFLISLAVAIWPVPVSYEHGDAVLFVNKDVPFYWYEAGAKNVGSFLDQIPLFFASNSNTGLESQDSGTLKRHGSHAELSLSENATHDSISGDDIISFAIDSTWKTVFEQNFYPWKFHPRDWDEPSPGTSNTSYVSRVEIRLLSADPKNVAKPLAGEVDESYSLSLTKEGLATISANTSVGVSRGLNTFTQLFYAHSDQDNVYTPLAPVTIFDAPKFEHRGINLDVSRNYFAVSDVKRHIDACAYNKMNRFHLHVTDAQSWPLEIPSMPELSAKGAYRPDYVYTSDDFKNMQRHAALQGVEMITEIDMPGHTSSIHHSFPDLVAAFNIQPDW